MYQNLINTVGGAIIAGDNYSPRDRILDANEGTEHEGTIPNAADIPSLGKWSDIVGLEWSMHGGGTVNYIFRSNVQNVNTKAIIQGAFQRTAGVTSVGAYPGRDFTVSSDGTGGDGENFYALLGSYHSAGPAYLLAQHRGAVGGMRRIRKIKVWNQGSAWTLGGDYDQLAPCMMLTVEAVPQDEEQGGSGGKRWIY
jgi:hypothetical protein